MYNGSPNPVHGRESDYARYLKPHVAELLASVGLDVVYEGGSGDWLYYRDHSGRPVEVLDMVGGFGAGLFGHNHPELVATAQRVLAEGRPMLSQASIRSEAGFLARELAGAVQKSTGHDYIVTLANSGGEAAEAAIKHAAYHRSDRSSPA